MISVHGIVFHLMLILQLYGKSTLHHLKKGIIETEFQVTLVTFKQYLTIDDC